jgi:hypothetical protein
MIAPKGLPCKYISQPRQPPRTHRIQYPPSDIHPPVPTRAHPPTGTHPPTPTLFGILLWIRCPLQHGRWWMGFESNHPKTTIQGTRAVCRAPMTPTRSSCVLSMRIWPADGGVYRSTASEAAQHTQLLHGARAIYLHAQTRSYTPFDVEKYYYIFVCDTVSRSCGASCLRGC